MHFTTTEYANVYVSFIVKTNKMKNIHAKFTIYIYLILTFFKKVFNIIEYFI